MAKNLKQSKKAIQIPAHTQERGQVLRSDSFHYRFVRNGSKTEWLIELSDNKLSNNKLSDNNLASELVENRSL